jgi:hypothetical protein
MLGENMKFWTEQEFFTFTKFRDLLMGSDEFDFGDLCMGYYDQDVYNRMYKEYSDWVFDLPVRIDRDDHVFRNFDKELQEAKDLAEKGKDHPKETYLKILKKLESGKDLSLGDVGTLSWIWTHIYERVHFQPRLYKLTPDQKSDLDARISKYLEHFENDELKIDTRNYYRFALQKGLFLERIESGQMIAKYGKTFVLTEVIKSDGSSAKDPNFLFVHTAYALADMGYLDITNSWSDMEFREGTEDKHMIRVNVTVHDPLLAELKRVYQKQNPTVVIESYDTEKGLLKFSGKSIFFTKKGLETDAMRLMKTLMLVDEDDWIERGEVFDDWGFTETDRVSAAKNKIYFAMQTINETVAQETGIKDLIEGNTRRWRINPRYRQKS